MLYDDFCGEVTLQKLDQKNLQHLINYIYSGLFIILAIRSKKVKIKVNCHIIITSFQIIFLMQRIYGKDNR